jgi:signal transduction histidine kinase
VLNTTEEKPEGRIDYLNNVRQQGIVHLETTHRRKDGHIFPVEVSTSIVNIGGHEMVLGIDRDITERKRAEEELKQNEIKRDKLERELIQSQKLESLGTLASGIAHDFNNLLSIIMMHTSVVNRLYAKDLTIQKHVEAVMKASTRGAGLVKQMLAFARKNDVLTESVMLNDLVNEIVRLPRETFPKTITVTTHLGQDLPSIEADATQVHQVLLNLCVNARDAMPSGGTLTITTHRQSGEALRDRHTKATAEDYIVLSVADTGIGMDEETQRRLFEPFFTTKECGKGTGLGLSLVFGIMESHDGFVAFQSELGKGTTFHCYFPVPQRMPEPAEAEEPTAEEITGGSET